MKDLEFFKQNGINTSKFIQSRTPNFVWDLSQNTFENGHSDFFKNTKPYSVHGRYITDKFIENISIGITVWFPCPRKNVLRCINIKNKPPLLNFLNINTTNFVGCSHQAFNWDFDLNYFNNTLNQTNSLKFILREYKELSNLEFDGIIVWNIRSMVFENRLRYCRIKKY